MGLEGVGGGAGGERWGGGGVGGGGGGGKRSLLLESGFELTTFNAVPYPLGPPSLTAGFVHEAMDGAF